MTLCVRSVFTRHNTRPQETENAVRIWYERYDEILAAAIQENLDLKTLRNQNLSNGYELCQQSQDYEYCEGRRMAEMRGAQHDRNAWRPT